MARIAEDVLDRGGLDHFALVHHHDFFGHVGDDPEVVRDQQHRHLQLELQRLHQLQDLRLDGDVQRGGRLVGHQQRRTAHQRHRDHRTLAQAAGELERIGVLGLDRIFEAHQPQHLEDRVAARRLAEA